jgi:PleD family two-component response regulator
VQLGGALQLSSTVGKGTTATLLLPVATAVPETESPTHKPQKVNRSAVILFVDDDPLIALSTTEMLVDLGHHVIGASSGLHALDILRSEQPLDLMMTDHVMPILLATGYAELPEGSSVDLPRLAKPYHQDQLRDRLDQLLG